MAAPKKSALPASPPPRATGANDTLRILIADDHDIVLHGLKQLLLEHFSAVTFGEARNATQALERCEAEPWHAMLLDITMPGRSGLDILTDLKALRPQLPVLIMSALPEEEFALRALKAGAAGYIDKRTLAGEIVTAIKRAISGHRYVSATLASKLAEQLGGGDSRSAHETLSQREFQVLRLIASGKTIKEIAAALFLSEKTVSTYRTRIAEKLNLGTNVELTRYALQHRLVE
jgi:two-component system invasion response regulator UvrY